MNPAQSQVSSIKDEYSQSKDATYRRGYYLEHPEQLDKQLVRNRKCRARKRMREVVEKRATRTQVRSDRVPAVIAEVRHHMERGRDAGRISVWMNRPVVEIEKYMAAIKEGK